MAKPTLVWDIGGVLLSNGWDHDERTETAAHFGLDLAELDRRVTASAADYEEGKSSLAEFLGRAVFYEPRPFTLAECRDYVFNLSKPNEPVLQFARQLARKGRYTMVALNNEGREFNNHRVAKFGLTSILSAFFSSCYTGLRKPRPEAFRCLTDVLRLNPMDCYFIDDRPENVEAARSEGWNATRFETVDRLREALKEFGFELPST